MAYAIEGEFEPVEGADSRKRSPEERRERLSSFVGELQKEAEERVGRRRTIEQRWLEDLRQYHGIYEDRLLQDLRAQDGSELFLNLTRHKTNTAAAKLSDMLFPTDDKNWAIKPTPVPRIAKEIDEADAMGAKVQDRANKMLDAGNEAGAQALVAEAAPVLDRGAQARTLREVARRAAVGMEAEIDDQLRECNYNVEVRTAIEDSCQIGTGVMMGPVSPMVPEKQWRQVEGPDGQAVSVLEDAPDRKRAAIVYVDPWHFFPDMDATNIKDSDGVYLRHLYKAKDLRKMARMKGVSKDAIRALLKEGPRDTQPYFVADMRSITNSNTESGGQCYHVWRAFVALDVQQLVQIALADGRDDMAADYEDIDPLTEIHVCVWFCQGQLIGFAEHPLDTNEVLFSVFCWQNDKSSIFGYGVPYTVRDTQSGICAAWRMIFDQGGLSAVPQVVIDKHSVEPEDGDWKLSPGKLWLTTKPTPQGHRVFEVHPLTADLAALMQIINAAIKFIDDETGITQLAQGEQGANITKTAQGMAMLMNSTNVVFKRVVKAFDDDLTTPNIRRTYHWTMQWSDDRAIKGDFNVDARGSSVLLVREIQSQNMVSMLQFAMSDPELRAMTKVPDAYRSVVKVLQIPVEEWVKTEEELAEMAAQAANQPPPPDPEMEKIAVQREIAQGRDATSIKVAEMRYEAALQVAAQSGNAQLDSADTVKETKRMEVEGKERALAAEMAMAEQTGKSAGGSV